MYLDKMECCVYSCYLLYYSDIINRYSSVFIFIVCFSVAVAHAQKQYGAERVPGADRAATDVS